MSGRYGQLVGRRCLRQVRYLSTYITFCEWSGSRRKRGSAPHPSNHPERAPTVVPQYKTALWPPIIPSPITLPRKTSRPVHPDQTVHLRSRRHKIPVGSFFTLVLVYSSRTYIPYLPPRCLFTMASHDDNDHLPEETQGYKLSQPKQSLAEYENMGRCSFIPIYHRRPVCIFLLLQASLSERLRKASHWP